MLNTVTLASRLSLVIALTVFLTPTSASGQLQSHDHAHHAARDLSAAPPAEVGLSASRLERLAAGMQQMVDDGKLAGIVTMLARHGKVAFVNAVGVQDVDSETPMSSDTIFRIYSMTKPITGVAMMMLYEEGKWRLNDPISKFIPEFANLKVHTGAMAGASPILEASDRPMTMRELMTHSGGLDYSGSDAVGRRYRERRVPNPNAPLQQLIDDLAELPLRSQPGTQYHYSVSVDVQGYLVEKLSGQPFDEFLLTRIFEPLGMGNTGFFVPSGSTGRAARIHRALDNGQLEAVDAVRTRPPAAPLGGQGLYSTAGDYLRFTQMLLNGGTFNGERLLAPRTVEMMRTNHLHDEPLATVPENSVSAVGGGLGLGWGLDFEVVLDAAAGGEPWRNGTYYWLGAAGTWFWIDPASDLTFVGMIQHRGSASADVRALSRSLVYQALVD
jgi:CubicO group peptidase (beta-lactamase class C family)